MLTKIKDTKKLYAVLQADCPVPCIGIRMKIKALLQAYGADDPYCSFYLSEDGLAVAALYHSSLLFSDAQNRSLTWEDSLSLLPVSSISSDTALDLTGFVKKQGTFFKKENPKAELSPETITYGNIGAAYNILYRVFPETFVFADAAEEKDFYMQWYCEMSHRIRHGVSDVAVLEEKATASVYCIEADKVFLSQIGVLPGLRGGGYGRRLLTAVMQKYAGRDCYVFSKNPNADKFYHALGFTPVGTWQDYTRKE